MEVFINKYSDMILDATGVELSNDDWNQKVTKILKSNMSNAKRAELDSSLKVSCDTTSIIFHAYFGIDEDSVTTGSLPFVAMLQAVCADAGFEKWCEMTKKLSKVNARGREGFDLEHFINSINRNN